MNEGLLAQFSLVKKKLDLLEGSASNNGDGNHEDEVSEQKGEKSLLVRMYQARGSGRCYDKRLTQKDTRDNTLQIREVSDSTAGVSTATTRKKRMIELSFSSVWMLLSHIVLLNP